jgi:hypothetical protein
MAQSNEQNFTKRNRKKQFKEQKRLERERALAAKKRKKYLTYAILVIAIAILGYVGYDYMTTITRYAVPVMNSWHLSSLTQPHEPYNTDPPTSGPHFEGHVEQKISNQPIPKEIQVHELEHGGVLIQYNCKSCDDLIAKLEKHARSSEHVIMAPYPGMDAKIALTAWGKLAKLNEYDEKIITEFIKVNAGKNHGN